MLRPPKETIRSPGRRPPCWAGSPVTWRTSAPSRGGASEEETPSHARSILPSSFEPRDDRLDGVDRHGEADAGVAAAAVGGDLRVDADDAALGVEQRAAGVAGVDRGVGLDHAGDREAVGRLDVAVERGDDAAGDGALEAERAADGDRRLAGVEVAGVGERERLDAALDLALVDVEQREVGGGIGADDLGVDRLAVLGEADGDLGRRPRRRGRWSRSSRRCRPRSPSPEAWPWPVVEAM